MVPEPSPFRLRGDPEKPLGEKLRAPKASSPKREEARRLCCALCARPITSEEDCVDVEGAHAHTRMNPAGVVFGFRCFRAAEGCKVSGEPTSAASWFSGCVWQYAHCGGCGVHLGWYFSGQSTFFGLVSERLVLPS